MSMRWEEIHPTMETAKGRRGIYSVERRAGIWMAFAPDEDETICMMGGIDRCKQACSTHDQRDHPDYNQPNGGQ